MIRVVERGKARSSQRIRDSVHFSLASCASNIAIKKKKRFTCHRNEQNVHLFYPRAYDLRVLKTEKKKMKKQWKSVFSWTKKKNIFTIYFNVSIVFYFTLNKIVKNNQHEWKLLVFNFVLKASEILKVLWMIIIIIIIICKCYVSFFYLWFFKENWRTVKCWFNGIKYVVDKKKKLL